MSVGTVIGAACGALTTIIGGAIWLLVFGPIANGIFPVFETNTPLYWFNFLNGGMIVWIIKMIYIIIVLACAFASFGVVASAFQVQEYDN
jgi:hypothetical protein